jgi:hypothetical protein
VHSLGDAGEGWVDANAGAEKRLPSIIKSITVP